MTETNVADLSFLFIVFYVSLLLALIFVPFSKKIAFALGVIDHPDARKVHHAPLTRMGGLGIACAFLLTVVLCIKIETLTMGVPQANYG